ncbi:ESAT-6 protein secretion system EspG family protein [Amycolatopsis sulphurea]|uniref:ESAT-6 protein secretion system EspG family protein n=1 Tax=Amycolatopsis sulphurea TaxID=76022 RepID=A0A2A9G3B1_9PSEU|nr:ESAT-6 protein secretion system EspG family protein [Amycolatopsis sulphurea]
MVIDAPVTVPRVALAWAWDSERIGPAHPVVGVMEWWLEEDVAASFDELMRQALAEPGFYDLRRRRLTGDFRDVLWGISTADAECYRISSRRDERRSASLAVLTGRSALLITVDDDQATLVRIPADRLCRAVVDTLPELRPGRYRRDPGAPVGIRDRAYLRVLRPGHDQRLHSAGQRGAAPRVDGCAT